MAMDLGIKPIMNLQSGGRNPPIPVASKGAAPAVFALDSNIKPMSQPSKVSMAPQNASAPAAAPNAAAAKDTTPNASASSPQPTTDPMLAADSASGPSAANGAIARPPQSDVQAPADINEPLSKNDIQRDPSKTLQTMAKTQTATRQAAMQIFLDKMQNELGVDQSEVLEAFSKLSPDALMAPPEESSAEFVKQLNLDPTQSKKALGLYNEMLAMMAATGMAQYLAKNGQSADIQVDDKAHANLKALRNSIGQMDDKFFMNGPYAAPAQPTQAQSAYAAQAYGQNALTDDAAANDPLSNLSAADKKSLDPAAKNNSNSGSGAIDISKFQQPAAGAAAALTPAELAAMANQSAPAASAGAAAETADADEGADTVLKKLLSNAGVKTAVNPMATPAAMPEKPAVDVSAKATTTTAATAAAAGTAVTALKSGDKSGAGADGEGSKKSDDITNNPIQPQDLNAKNAHAGKAFNVETPKNISTADVQANIKELISQAQFLSKRGGGEMKMSLNPEGLGEVNLKVTMQNGQVNVQMVASNDDAKKILEKGLGELKQAFAGHKISLDTIRIDSPKDMSNQFSQQRQEQERNFQQRFLGDFQDRNGMNRREMFEYPGASVPSSQRSDPASNAAAYAYNKKRDSSRRLDLVA